MPTNYQVRIGKRAQKKLKKMDKHQSHLIMSWIKKNLSIKRVLAYPRERLKSQSLSRGFVIAIHNLLISSKIVKFVILRIE